MRPTRHGRTASPLANHESRVCWVFNLIGGKRESFHLAPGGVLCGRGTGGRSGYRAQRLNATPGRLLGTLQLRIVVDYFRPGPSSFGAFSGLRNRIHSRLHPDEDMNAMPANQVIYQPSAMPAAMPQRLAPTSAEPPAASPVQPISAEKLDLPIRKQFVNKIGAAEDYSWITGQLFYVHADGGRWVLRYAGVDQEDKYGGSVVLKPAAEMRNFREGDLVSVNGEILGDTRASKHLGGPLYRVTSISMIERAD